MNIEILQSLCGDSGHPTVAKPFSFQVDGRWFNAATNGHAIAAVETMSPDYVRENAPPAKELFVKRGKPTHTLDVGALSDWLEACEMWETCEGCQGTGSHNCNCLYCEIVNGSSCGECDGDKGSWAQLPVNFEHVQFNRVLLARYLSPFRSSGIAQMWLTKEELAPFEIRGDGWRLLVMPMRKTEGDEAVTLPTGLIEVT